MVVTSLGRFRSIAPEGTQLADRWLFECPGCSKWAHLNDDQWHGRVSVDCAGGYHETHDYAKALEKAFA